MSMTTDTCAPPSAEDDHYEDFLAALRARVTNYAGKSGALFTTRHDVSLYDVFLGGLPPERQQHYNCRTCRRFVETYGRLAAIDGNGDLVPFLWSDVDVPAFFRHAVEQVAAAVRRARVGGVFFTAEKQWGVASNASAKPPFWWNHMAVTPDAALLFVETLDGDGRPVKTAEQATAEKREDRAMLVRALVEYPLDVAQKAVHLLMSETFYRSEQGIAVAQWFFDLSRVKESFGNAAPRARWTNLLWRSAAAAPAGFCHVRNTVVGSLLDDVKANLSVAEIQRRWNEKMAPSRYRRPVAPPTEGNIVQAERLVAAMGLTRSLERRFARLDEVVPHAVWTPKAAPAASPPSGVFGHLRQRGASLVSLVPPAAPMTWEKFQRTVLPAAKTVEVRLPAGNGPYYALVTAVHPDAPPILQWDRTEKRNPVSWYVHEHGSPAVQWGLRAGSFVPVTALVPSPNMWDAERPQPHHGEKVLFLLEGARDLAYKAGGGFFMNLLRSELHPVRATLEAHVKGAVVAANAEGEAPACGVGLSKGVGTWGITVRVTTDLGVSLYDLDRWD